jgi:nitrogen fixation protein
MTKEEMKVVEEMEVELSEVLKMMEEEDEVKVKVRDVWYDVVRLKNGWV